MRKILVIVLVAGLVAFLIPAMALAATWTDTGSIGGTYVYALARNGSNLYAGCDNGHVYGLTVILAPGISSVNPPSAHLEHGSR